MKRTPAVRLPIRFALTGAALSFLLPAAGWCESPAEELFNGKDLAGWEGDSSQWKVEDGIIVGTTAAEDPIEYNQFLIFSGEPVENFELEVELRLTSEGNNSGIQYRSQVRPDLGEQVVAGYQCDIHPAAWAHGMLYDEKGRGILCKRGQKAVITGAGEAKVIDTLPEDPEFPAGEWNTYRIVARGNHLVHEVNGVKTVEVFDHHEAERELRGTIAFQVHRGPPMKVEIRRVTLKRLPKADLVSPDATPVSDDAPHVHPPRGKGKGKGKGKARAKGKG